VIAELRRTLHAELAVREAHQVQAGRFFARTIVTRH
jgi:hypothetical protein